MSVLVHALDSVEAMSRTGPDFVFLRCLQACQRNYSVMKSKKTSAKHCMRLFFAVARNPRNCNTKTTRWNSKISTRCARVNPVRLVSVDVRCSSPSCHSLFYFWDGLACFFCSDSHSELTDSLSRRKGKRHLKCFIHIFASLHKPANI